MSDVHRLFFAVRLDPEARSSAVDVTQWQMDSHHLSGDRVPPKRLHITLHWLGDHEVVVPQELLHRAREAGGSVEMAPFGVGFDRVGSLGPEMGGLALTGAAELENL